MSKMGTGITVVSRAQRGTQCCAADPGPRFLKLGPGSAVHRFALHRVRGTS